MPANAHSLPKKLSALAVGIHLDQLIPRTLASLLSSLDNQDWTQGVRNGGIMGKMATSFKRRWRGLLLLWVSVLLAFAGYVVFSGKFGEDPSGASGVLGFLVVPFVVLVSMLLLSVFLLSLSHQIKLTQESRGETSRNS